LQDLTRISRLTAYPGGIGYVRPEQGQVAAEPIRLQFELIMKPPSGLDLSNVQGRIPAKGISKIIIMGEAKQRYIIGASFSLTPDTRQSAFTFRIQNNF